MRTALILGGAAVGVYFLWRSGVLASVEKAVAGAIPVAQANPGASASMVQGASAVSQVGPSTFRGLMSSPRPQPAGTTFLGGSAASGTVRTAGTLLLSDMAPKPATFVPVQQSGTTTGVGYVRPAAPPPQQLNPTVNPAPSYYTRGIVL